MNEIGYIPDDEFEQMLRVLHQPSPLRSKRSVTLDYGSGMPTGSAPRSSGLEKTYRSNPLDVSTESTMTVTLVWDDSTSIAPGILISFDLLENKVFLRDDCFDNDHR